MKLLYSRCLLLALFLVLGIIPVQAQLSINLRMHNSRSLLYEPLRCDLEIRNASGAPVLLEEDEIGFRVQRAAGRLVDLTEEPPFVDGIVVPANGRVTHTVNLLSYYPLFQTGPYTVEAWVILDGERYVSRPAFIDIVPGFELEKNLFINPGSGERRTFSLLTVNRDHHERLLVRIDDAAGKVCFGVMDLGDLIRIDPPKILLDNEAILHVLHLTQPGLYFHSKIAFDGAPVSQKAYYAQTAQIRMEVNPAGLVEILGGTSVEDTEVGDMPVRRIPPRK